MTDITTHTITSGAMRDRFDQFFAALGQGFNAYLMDRSRRGQIEALEALSDEQLAACGLRRSDIPRHVFHDLFYR